MPDKVVVDANVVISSLINKGKSFSVFELNCILGKIEFIAPEFLLTEVKKHEAKALRFAKLSEHEFTGTYKFLIEAISFIPAKEFIQFLPEAKKLAPHPKDAPYIALSLAMNCPILSGDKGLKAQNKVKVLSPSSLFLSMLGTAT